MERKSQQFPLVFYIKYSPLFYYLISQTVIIYLNSSGVEPDMEGGTSILTSILTWLFLDQGLQQDRGTLRNKQLK